MIASHSVSAAALRIVPFLLAATVGLAQDAAPPPAAAPAVEDAPPARTPLVPGELPRDAVPEARALWQRFVAAHRTAPAAAGPVTSFDVQFSLRSRRGAQTNDLRARLMWREPALVRFSPEGQAEVGRDATGRPWLKSGNEVVALRGRDYETDREQLDQAVELAQSFARLSDPTRLRIAALRPGTAPRGLPTIPRLNYNKLVWLELETPDFGLGARDRDEAGALVLDLVRLGFDETNLTPRVAQVTRIQAPPRPGAEAMARAPVVEQIWILDDVRPVQGGRRVPHKVLLYERLLDAQRPSERAGAPAQELYLLSGRFDVELPDARFAPTP